MQISFPAIEPRYVFERVCLAFPALADGKPIECYVTAELLNAGFGATDFTEKSMREAYTSHRAEVQALAQGHIENGWIDDQNRVFLTTRHTRLSVTYDDDVDKIPRGRDIATSAQRFLTGIIGPNAQAVDVRWVASVERPFAGIYVEISDPVTKYFARGFVGQKETIDGDFNSFHLAKLWSGVLGERSRVLTGNLG